MKFKLWLFREMPLTNYHVGPFQEPNPQTPGKLGKSQVATDYFSPRDRKAIQTPTVAKKLEQVLAKSTGYNFNIIFLEYDKYFQLPNRIDTSIKSQYAKQVEMYCQANGIPLSGHITYAKNSSTGHVLTPWMTLHTLGHALLDSTNYNDDIEELLSSFTKQVIGSNVYTLKNLFQFKSAKSDESLSEDEMIYEFVAEYLWHGHIRYNKDAHFFTTQGITQIGETKIKNLVAGIEKIINNALLNNVGKVIVDFYRDV